MAVAQEMYVLTAVVVVIVLGTLALVNKLEKQLFILRQRKTYQITLNNYNQISDLDALFAQHGIKGSMARILKTEGMPIAVYKISCGMKKHNAVSQALAESSFVYSFEV
jgi:uncharacterized membrane protein YhiD involved in acid resistance